MAATTEVLLSFFLYGCLCLNSVFCMRINNKTYVDINGHEACFRRFNATHQIGCSSSRSGDVGVVHYIETEADVEWVVSHGGERKYSVLMQPNMFVWDNVKKLWNADKLSGIMVIKNQASLPPLASFSPDLQCPNEGSGMYSNNSEYQHCRKGKWNDGGTGMMFQDYDFPILILDNMTEVNYIIDHCYKKYNKPGEDQKPRDYPLCAVQLKDSMSGAIDSVTCMRRQKLQFSMNKLTYCDPMSDSNVVATIKAVPSNNGQTYSVIMAAARMDTFSMFDNTYPGADSPVSGIVALLAAAQALGKVKGQIAANDSARDIMFAFFQGEAFDYIGSSQMVYNMSQKEFPMKPQSGTTTLHGIQLQDISHFVEVSQLAQSQGKVWLHTDPISNQTVAVKKEIDDMVTKVTKIAQDLGIPVERADGTLPPASVQTFLKKRTLPSVVLADHKTSFNNKYYNSRFDEGSTIGADPGNVTNPYNHVTEQAKNLTKISTLLARHLYFLSTGSDDKSIEASETTVTNLLYCFLYAPACEAFRQVIQESQDSSLTSQTSPWPFYVSVDSTDNVVTMLTQRLLSSFLGDPVANVSSSDQCTAPDASNQVYRYTWMQGPELNGSRTPHCVRSTVLKLTAESPAFTITDYDWRSGEYPMWTESSWMTDSISMRVFLVPSTSYEASLLVIGLILTLVSMAIAFLCNRQAGIIFLNSRSSHSFLSAPFSED